MGRSDLMLVLRLAVAIVGFRLLFFAIDLIGDSFGWSVASKLLVISFVVVTILIALKGYVNRQGRGSRD